MVKGSQAASLPWKPGTLDPSRALGWTTTDLWPAQLVEIKVPPVFATLILRGDPFEPYFAYEHFQAFTDGGRAMRLPRRGNKRRATLKLDFGRVLPGTVEIGGNPPAATTVTFETGEALEPTRAYRAQAIPDGTRNVFRPAIKHGGWGSFRFVWVHFDDYAAEFTVEMPVARARLAPVGYAGSFACSDPTLNAVWELCAYSAHTALCQPAGDDPAPQPVLQTLTLDRNDRFPWAGDSRAIQYAVAGVFGQYRLIREAIDQFIPPGTRPIPDLNTIPPYTLDWALGLIDYFRTSGDDAYAKRRLPDLVAVMEKFDAPVPAASEGLGLFFDWDHRLILPTGGKPPGSRPELEACFTGKYVQFCRDLAWLAQCVGAPKESATANNTADRHAAGWLSEHPHAPDGFGIHALTNLVLGDVLPRDKWKTIYARIFADPEQRHTESPFFTIYIPQALAKMGYRAEALDVVRRYWGSMIAAGATTVWEEWSPEWKLATNSQPPQFGFPATYGGLSLNQLCGSAPARWLIETILGFEWTQPGVATAVKTPPNCGLDWARGALATPAGPVSQSVPDPKP